MNAIEDNKVCLPSIRVRRGLSVALFVRLFVSLQLRLFVQDCVQQGTMHLDLSVVADQSELAKFVQEKTHAGSGRPYHLRQGCLIDRSLDGCWLAVFSEVGQQKKKACQPFLTRIEYLVYKIFLDAIAAGHQVSHEKLREPRLLAEGRQH